ncbi:MAG: hypothetical protein KKC75_06460 [Nanoarchaeota archaeon]|nr:hypothetical protein [Nanoarchaeota archaeon]MBU1005623.1 hypothetical protein [Nanoarchaeota archaeon]MBU1946357.1 hypothetical protein [Nanoarchaeota archaeon]
MKNKKPLKNELTSRRVFFKNDNIRNEFFNKLKIQFGNWTKLRKQFNIYKSKLERIKNGIYSIKYSLFLNFLEYFNETDQKFFQQQIILKDRGWGRSKGGISTYKRHKYIFEKGRKIGSMQSRYHFSINTPLTPQLCELIGAFIGDGFTNRYGNIYVIQFTGNSKLDKEYIVKTLKPIIKEISQDSSPIITEKDNTIRLTINSKEFHNLLTRRFGFVAGKKTYTVTIPNEIIDSGDKELINRCIRGIFDTDGCVFRDKRKSYKLPYLRIALHMKSKNLVNQIHSLLLNQGINSRITEDIDIIQINGVENCKKFIEKIGFSNKRHLDKLKF